MIINLWSTPRTGSVWYSMHLAKTYNAKRITELFNPYHMNIYHKQVDGKIFNYHTYIDKSYYHEYVLLDGKLSTKHINAPRTRSVNEEFEYRVDLIKLIKDNDNLILHNHVAPIDESIRQYLSSTYPNIYIYRRDRRAQCASYCIAYTTKIFANFRTPHQYDIIDEVPEIQLRQLVERIKRWDEIPKDGDIIAYEDIEFVDTQGFPRKQVSDYTKVLSQDALARVDKILEEYNLCPQVT